MTDYTKTRDAASRVTEKFNQTLKNLKDELQDEIVVVTLMEYYDMCSKPDKIDNTVDEYIDPDEDLLWAIDRVLQDFMPHKDYQAWVISRGYPKR